MLATLIQDIICAVKPGIKEPVNFDFLYYWYLKRNLVNVVRNWFIFLFKNTRCFEHARLQRFVSDLPSDLRANSLTVFT